MPTNRPPGRHGIPAGHPEPGTGPRISRKTVLIVVLLVAALVGAVLVGTTAGDPRPTGAEQAAPSTSDSATPAAPSSDAVSASPSPSTALSMSASQSPIARLRDQRGANGRSQ